MDRRRSEIPLQRFFAGLAEYTFQTRLGVADPPLIEYISSLLARFIHNDRIYQVRNPTGRRLEEVGEMLVEADARQGNARRQVHRHIGDFTLFWTGLYPEALRRRQRSAHWDFFLDYCNQGKRAYLIASTLPGDESEDDSEVLARLSHEFELCAYGLSELRREWSRHEGDAPEPPLLLE